jgi:3-deoxy-D-manno-octulosonic-acid transferase
VETGGHNVLEPALHARPVLFGPHTSNFREAAALLVGADAGVVVADPDALADQLAHLLDDPARRAAMGAAGRAAVASGTGAVRATLELVERFVVPATHARANGVA